MWYPIDNHLLRLEPTGLQDVAHRSAFLSRFNSETLSLGLSSEVRDQKDSSGDLEAQRKQRQHFDAWALSAGSDYFGYASQPFWRAVDAITFSRWHREMRSGSHLLDIGCANGRSSLYWARNGSLVTGFDISVPLVQQAIETAHAEGLGDRVTFFVADGERLPLKSETFENVLTYGVLHHLPAPRVVTREIQRILVSGGTHFGSENNQSIFRRLFDVLMKLLPLWHEEAGEQPLISPDMLRTWLDGLPAQIETRTTVFVPPHVCNWLGERTSVRLLVLTDRIASAVPWVRKQGGLMMFEVRKIRAPRSNGSGARDR